MKHDITGQRVDPALAPDQFSVVQPLGPDYLDRCVTQHGVYPSLPGPTGVPWTEYIRSQRNRSRSDSSSTEALDSDHARYITSWIDQHARSMATGTRSLPTDSLSHTFNQLKEDICQRVDSDMDSQKAVLMGIIQIPPHQVNIKEISEKPGGIGYHSVATESDRLSVYTGLDDYDTLFEARHGRGALDHVPRKSEEVVITSSMGITPTTLSMGLIANSMDKVKTAYDNESLHTSQREHVSLKTDPLRHRVVSSSSGHIIGEGAVIFTDMTETMLTALDQQMAMSSDAQKPEGSLNGNNMTARELTGDNQVGEMQARTQITSDTKDIYPDLYLPVAENYRISDQFCGYLDSLSADNKPMTLVELKGLSYRYRTSIYAVDRVNGTMHGKFSVGYRIIHEKSYCDTPIQIYPFGG